VSQLNLYVPDEFAKTFRNAADDAGCLPTHLLQAQTRVLERYDLAAEVRAEAIAVSNEGWLRQDLGSSAGGRAGKGRPKPRRPPKT
jgi:hypothetical protein